MDHIKKILVPLAFTDYSAGVFECACQACNEKTQLVVLSIINDRDIASVETVVSMGYDVDADHYVENIRKERTRRLNEMISKIGIDKKRVSLTFKIGKPVDEILKMIHDESPDLVVMGTRGRTGLKNSIMGSVAEKVFKRSPVNVLSYRDEDVKAILEKKLHL